jgi:hypothetical protein
MVLVTQGTAYFQKNSLTSIRPQSMIFMAFANL